MDNRIKLILGAVAGVAGWRALGPNGQQIVLDALNKWVSEPQKKKQEELGRLALFWINQEMIIRSTEPQEALPAATLDAPKVAAPVETDAPWLDVIVAAAVILILGKRGSGNRRSYGAGWG